MTNRVPADFKNARRQKTSLGDPGVDRLPPNSIEAEQGVLGCCLLSPKDCVSLCIEKFGGKSEVFYSLANRTIFDCLVMMSQDNEAIDLITVRAALRDLLQLEAVGGLAYLASLPDAVPSAANLEYYLAIVLEKYVLRTSIAYCTDFVSRSYEHQGETEQLIDELQHDVLGLSHRGGNGTVIHAKPAALAAMQRIEEISQLKGKAEGIATGFTDFDRMTGGLKAGEMIVIAARPGKGKTAYSLNIVDHVAVGCGIAVAVFSLEMSTQSLMMRALCSRARISMTEIRSGTLPADGISKLIAAQHEISKAPLYIDDSSGLIIMQLRAKARRYQQQYGIKLFVIDYLQLLLATERSNNRQEEIGEISRGVQSLGKELEVPVIVLAQLNRDVEKEKGRKPRMSDLREGGNVEGDADVIGLLYEQTPPEGTVESAEMSFTNLLLGKNRHGPVGEVPLVFFKNITRFESYAPQPAAPTTPPTPNKQQADP